MEKREARPAGNAMALRRAAQASSAATRSATSRRIRTGPASSQPIASAKPAGQDGGGGHRDQARHRHLRRRHSLVQGPQPGARRHRPGFQQRRHEQGESTRLHPQRLELAPQSGVIPLVGTGDQSQRLVQAVQWAAQDRISLGAVGGREQGREVGAYRVIDPALQPTPQALAPGSVQELAVQHLRAWPQRARAGAQAGNRLRVPQNAVIRRQAERRVPGCLHLRHAAGYLFAEGAARGAQHDASLLPRPMPDRGRR